MSIKVKFIFTILIILVVSLGAYLYFALNLFKEDKTSYIFESSHQTASLVSKEVENLIQVATYNAQIFSRLSANGVKLDESLLGLKSEFLMFVHKKAEDKREVFNPKLKDLYGVERETLFKIIESIQTTGKSIEIKNISKEAGVPAIGIFIKNTLTNEDFYYLVSMAKIVDSLSNSPDFEGYLFDSKGVFFGNKHDLRKEILQEVLNTEQISASKVSDSGDYLYSFVKIPHYDINIASVISKNKAFIAFRFLIERFLGVGAILFGLAIALGVYLSSSIANPIGILASNAESISKGEYGITVEISTGGEVKSLANSFNQMSVKIKETIEDLIYANQQLDYMNKNLEKLVDQRTRELRDAHSYLDAMINSFDQGLMVFDQQFVCNPVYTKVCEQHFDIAPGGRHFLDIVNIHEEKKRMAFDRWKDNLFQELIPFESIAELGPDSVVSGSVGDEKFKYISLKYFPMRGDDKKVKNIVVVATDTTREITTKRKLEAEKEETQRVINILENKEQFISFLNDLEAMNNHLAKMASGSEKISASEVKPLLHSIKGSAGVYYLGDIYKKIDGIEEKYQDLEDEEYGKNIREDLSYLKDFIDNEIVSLKKRIKGFVGEQIVDGVRRFEKRLDHINIVREKLGTENRNGIIKAFDLYIFRIEVKTLLRAYFNMVAELGMMLGKELRPLEFVGEATRIHPTHYESLFNSFSHVFRNMVDHGIEEPYEREKKNKSIEGKISVEVSRIEKELVVKLSDDGRGIDYEKIRKRLKKKNNDVDVASKTNSEIIQHIFDKDFSTKGLSTDISGRGVGLYAVKKEVQRLKGKIQVISSQDKGTSFIIKVPYV
ncbi:MAG: HAMP domain-containing protein [Deltaproteobacteria bacterium]|nr:MAG: HAMP domain-containing protein [Deltaproteobacteria bacterium]